MSYTNNGQNGNNGATPRDGAYISPGARRRQDQHQRLRELATATAMIAQQEKLLPQNVEAEAAFLGSILIDPEALTRAASWIRPEMFYRESHREIYHAMLETLRAERVYSGPNSGTPGDLIQTTDMLEQLNLLDEVGGVSYVSSLANYVPTSANWSFYAEIIERTFVCRRVIQASGQIAALAYAQGAVDELRAASLTLLREALAGERQQWTRSYEDVADEMAEQVEARVAGKPGAGVIPTGFAGLDKELGGLEPGELVMIGARPGVGKSSLGQGMLLNMMDALRAEAAATGGPVSGGLYVTMEMRAAQQVRRIISALGGINARAIRAGFHHQVLGQDVVDDASLIRFLETVATSRDTYGKQIDFVDRQLDVNQLADIVAEQVMERHCRVVLIDQIDLFQAVPGARDQAMNETALVAHVSKTLKQIANDFGVVIIALCQLNRESDGARPEMRHFRNSGRIEQDADIGILLHRPFDIDPSGSPSPNYPHYTEAWLGKSRGSGKSQMIPLYWIPTVTKFVNWPEGEPIPVIEADATGGSPNESPATRAKRLAAYHAQATSGATRQADWLQPDLGAHAAAERLAEYAAAFAPDAPDAPDAPEGGA